MPLEGGMERGSHSTVGLPAAHWEGGQLGSGRRAIHLHVAELVGDLRPELGDDCEEVLQGIPSNILVFIFEKAERTG